MKYTTTETRNNRCKSKKEILLLSELSRSFGRGILRGVLQYANIYKTWNVFHLERNIQEKYPDWFEHWKGDGIISRSGSTSLCKKLLDKGVPVIELMGDGKSFPAHVQIDERISSQMAVDHFYQRGFRSFAFFSLGHNWWSQERCDLFVNTLNNYNCDCHIAPMTDPETDATLPLIWKEGIEDDIIDWLHQLPKPVGVYCPWDIHALHLMNLCRQYEIAIPEEISILGYGNNADLCRWSDPPLSSIAPNGREVGFQASILLAKALAGEPIPANPVTVPPTHIEKRNSTDFVAVKNATLLKAIHFLRENISHNPSVMDLTRYLNISRSTLHRLFITHLGCSPNDEITRLRMEWAKQLLRETDMSITHIAKQLDFSSPSSFIRAFHTLFGLTPIDFRSAIVKNSFK